ncbi:MAG: hypothetical protein H0U40_06815, partial [Chloroflexia bacterium]|nr:hypothetical protein [Chloroflexia bacterium]
MTAVTTEQVSTPHSTAGADGAGDSRDIFDITIIGAGPTGLFAAFYA